MQTIIVLERNQRHNACSIPRFLVHSSKNLNFVPLYNPYFLMTVCEVSNSLSFSHSGVKTALFDIFSRKRYCFVIFFSLLNFKAYTCGGKSRKEGDNGANSLHLY